jgi:hypothetical protein
MPTDSLTLNDAYDPGERAPPRLMAAVHGRRDGSASHAEL